MTKSSTSECFLHHQRVQQHFAFSSLRMNPRSLKVSSFKYVGKPVGGVGERPAMLQNPSRFPSSDNTNDNPWIESPHWRSNPLMNKVLIQPFIHLPRRSHSSIQWHTNHAAISHYSPPCSGLDIALAKSLFNKSPATLEQCPARCRKDLYSYSTYSITGQLHTVAEHPTRSSSCSTHILYRKVI